MGSLTPAGRAERASAANRVRARCCAPPPARHRGHSHRPAEDLIGDAGLAQYGLVPLLGERRRSDGLELRAQLVRIGDGVTGHAVQLLFQYPIALCGQEGELCFAEGAGVRRNHDADLGHLPAAIRPRDMMDDHHIVTGQYSGTYRHTGAPHQFFRPGHGT
jgi:hypothetical protein